MNLDELAQRYAGAQVALETTRKYYHIHDTLSEQLDVTVEPSDKVIDSHHGRWQFLRMLGVNVSLLGEINPSENQFDRAIRWLPSPRLGLASRRSGTASTGYESPRTATTRQRLYPSTKEETYPTH